MQFFKLYENEKIFLKNFKRYAKIILTISIATYVFFDWDRFQNRYIKKEEDLEQGYYYLETSDLCIYKVDLLKNKSEVEDWYELQTDTVINKATTNLAHRRENKISPDRLFFTEYKKTLQNGLVYHYGYQYLNDNSNHRSYGMALDYFKHELPPNNELSDCDKGLKN